MAHGISESARRGYGVCTMIAVVFLVVLAARADGISTPVGKAGQRMTTSFAVSKDGTRVAYDVTGTGPALVLLHGGCQSRHVWHAAGYVGRLREQFTVITMDLRGHGESDKATTVEAYGIERLTEDILAVVDAAHVRRFAVWGYSYGGNVARYLPARSDRVTKLVIVGIPFGPAAAPPFREFILGLRTKWTPIVEADRAGTLDLTSLSAEHRALWQTGTPLGTIPVTLAWLSAMLDWPAVEPADLRCSTMWLVGTDNENAMPSVKEYSEQLGRTKVVLQLVPGLTHEEELTNVDNVFPRMLKFTGSL